MCLMARGGSISVPFSTFPSHLFLTPPTSTSWARTIPMLGVATSVSLNWMPSSYLNQAPSVSANGSGVLAQPYEGRYLNFSGPHCMAGQEDN